MAVQTLFGAGLDVSGLQNRKSSLARLQVISVGNQNAEGALTESLLGEVFGLRAAARA